MRAALGIAIAMLVAALQGCAAPGPQPAMISAPLPAPSAENYATVDQAVNAAITALAEKRLGDPTVERHERGATVRGELSGLAGAIYNSHGGSGQVTIESAFPGSTRLRISATTRSRLATERVGTMDALKGYNYSDPKYGREIEQRIAELLSKGDIAEFKVRDDRARAEWEAEQDRLAKEAKRKAEEEERLLADAKSGSRVTCMTDTDCRKAFQLAQIYVSTKSDMKIQLATDTIIETYNPTSSYRLGAKVIKIPGVGQSAEITLTVTCKDCHGTEERPMRRLSLILMRDFRPFIEERLR